MSREQKLSPVRVKHRYLEGADIFTAFKLFLKSVAVAIVSESNVPLSVGNSSVWRADVRQSPWISPSLLLWR